MQCPKLVKKAWALCSCCDKAISSRQMSFAGIALTCFSLNVCNVTDLPHKMPLCSSLLSVVVSFSVMQNENDQFSLSILLCSLTHADVHDVGTASQEEKMSLAMKKLSCTSLPNYLEAFLFELCFKDS